MVVMMHLEILYSIPFALRKSMLACPCPPPFILDIAPVFGLYVKSPTDECFNAISSIESIPLSTKTLYPYNYPSRCHSFEKRIHFSKPTSHLLKILPHICHSSYNFSPVFSAGISITGIRYSVPLFSIP